MTKYYEKSYKVSKTLNFYLIIFLKLYLIHVSALPTTILFSFLFSMFENWGTHVGSQILDYSDGP